MNSEVEKYVEEAKKLGANDDHIRRELFSAGWSIGEINAAIYNYRKKNNVVAPPPRPRPPVSGFPMESRYHHDSHSASVYHTGEFNSSLHSGISPEFNRKKKIAKVFNGIVFTGIIALCLVAIGLSAYMVIIPQLRSNPPFRTNAFTTDFVASFAGIKSASYTAGISILTENRNPNFKSLRETFPQYAPKEETSEYYYGYGAKDEHFITSMIRSQEIYSSIIPKDLKASLSVSGDVEKNSTEEFKPLGRLGLSGSFETPDFSMNGDIEFVTKDGEFYGRINHMPAFFIFNFDKIKGKWVKITPTKKSTSASTSDDLYLEEEKKRLVEQLQQIPKIVDEVGLLAVVGGPTREVLEGEKVYRYNLKINAEKILDYFDRMTPILRSATPKDQLVYFDEETKLQRKNISDPIFVSFVNYAQSNLTPGTYPVSVWVSEKTRMPLKIVISGTVVPEKNSKVMDNKGNIVTQENQQINLSGSVRLKNVNVPIEISAPTEFITFEEAEKLMGFGTTKSSSKSTSGVLK